MRGKILLYNIFPIQNLKCIKTNQYQTTKKKKSHYEIDENSDKMSPSGVYEEWDEWERLIIIYNINMFVYNREMEYEITDFFLNSKISSGLVDFGQG